MKYVAYTPREGAWAFTESNTPEEAVAKLRAAILERSVLSHPGADNQITAAPCTPTNGHFKP